ncbi:hypothetical protein [Pseudomonas gessardii]|uniref:Uncharacterized protein n=1 Tax=Pseudomonas gessardii TaxID=78544 RepID=A0A7Y1QLW5_9PSED|nr:hypothetical protein [Pseudomonas gessardii]NNA96525.1 hypothetical protein [Pseudomonas gessardii]
MDEQMFYEKIGQLLIDAGPSDAKKIIARAELFAEGDGGSYEFDYFNKAGDLNWFDPDCKRGLQKGTKRGQIYFLLRGVFPRLNKSVPFFRFFHKITYVDGSKAKVIDPVTYRPTFQGPSKPIYDANTTYLNPQGQKVKFNPVTNAWASE